MSDTNQLMSDTNQLIFLLNKMLANPSEIIHTETEIYNLLFNSSSVDKEYENYKFLLRSEFSFAYMFLYKLVNLENYNKIVNNNRFISDDFLLFLLTLKTSTSHLFYICKYFSLISNYNTSNASGNIHILNIPNNTNIPSIPNNTNTSNTSNNISSIVLSQIIINQRLDIINSISVKYLKEKRSNNLFNEISNRIILFSDILLKVGKGINESLDNLTNSDINNFYSIFYSLTFQDIHPFFEDNLSIFMDPLYNRAKSNSCIYNTHRRISLSIFKLFLTKYPELIDSSAVITVITENANNEDFSSDIILEIIVKGYNRLLLSNFSNITPIRNYLISYINNSLLLSVPVSKKIDGYKYFTDLINEADSRSCIKDLIFMVNPNPNELSLDNIFYFYATIKLKSDTAIEKAKSILLNPPPPLGTMRDDVIIDMIYYLIIIKNPILVHFEYLENRTFYYPTCAITSSYLLENSYYHKSSFITNSVFNKRGDNNISFITDSNITSFNRDSTFNKGGDTTFIKEILEKKLNIGNLKFEINDKLNKISDFILDRFIISNNLIDEYSAEVLLRLVKDGFINRNYKQRLITFIYYNLLKMESFTVFSTVVNLFDLFMLLDSDKGGVYTNDLIRLITTKEISEAFHLLFYLIAHNIKVVDTSLVYLILQETSFYDDVTLRPALSILILSAYRESLINLDQIIAANKSLNSILLEGLYMKVLYKEIPDLNSFISEYKNSRSSCCSLSHPELAFLLFDQPSSELFSQFLDKRFARIILKKIRKFYVDDKIDRDNFIEIIVRNAEFIELEFTLISIIIKFDL